MTRLAFLLAGACVVALFSFGTAADDQPEAKKTGAALVADRVWWGAEFELTLTAPDTGEKFQRTRAGVVWDHLVFSNCFAADGKGALVAVVRFPKTKDEFTLRSIGPAEDLYALQIYQLEKTFPKLHKKIVDGAKDTPDVKVGQPKLPDNLKETDPVPKRLLPVVMAAGMKYGHREEFYAADEGRILGTEEFVDATIHRIGEPQRRICSSRKNATAAGDFQPDRLLEAVEKTYRVSRAEFCSRSKSTAAVTAKEILILTGLQLGASRRILSEITGLSSSALSRRCDAVRLKVQDNVQIRDLAGEIIKQYQSDHH